MLRRKPGLDDLIAGRNPVREALKAGRPINKIIILEGPLAGPLRDIFGQARDRRIPVHRVPRQRLDDMFPETAHQGVVALAAAREYAGIEDILAGVSPGEEPLLMLLDEIHDPYNLGAIIRTADAAGMHGVIIPRRRSVALTPAVARASAGAVEHIPVARVANIARTIENLQETGIWVVGADAAEGQLYWDVRLDGPLALVIGGEDKGLGRLVRDRCDLLVRVPMAGRLNSLNASVAAALLAFEAVRQRRKNK